MTYSLDEIRKAAKERRLIVGRLRKPKAQLDIFDAAEAEQEKQDGMTLAVDNLHTWKLRAKAWVEALEPGTQFDADDLVVIIGLPTDQDGRPTNNGIGGFICGLARKGIIVQAGWRKSSRVTNHAHLNRLWERR